MISLDPERPIQSEAEFRKQCALLGIAPEDDPVYLEIKDLVHQITDDQDIRGRSINISGAYGTGKTSFVNVLKDLLKHDHIVINARTMFYGNFDEYIEGVLSDMYYEVREEHGVKLTELIKLSHNMTVSLEGGINLGLVNIKSQIARTLNLVRPKSNDLLLKEDSKLNRKLASLFPKRIIIILDDIDRLKPDELLTALRFIEVLKQLDNVFVIAIGDVNQIGGILGALQLPKPYEFARKVFDHRVYLERSLRDRERIVQLMVGRLMGGRALTDTQKELVSEAFYFLIMTQIIQNVRALIREKFSMFPTISQNTNEFNMWWEDTFHLGNNEKLGPLYREIKAFYDDSGPVWTIKGSNIAGETGDMDALRILGSTLPAPKAAYELDLIFETAQFPDYWSTQVLLKPADPENIKNFVGEDGQPFVFGAYQKMIREGRSVPKTILDTNFAESRWSIVYKLMKDPQRNEMDTDETLAQLNDLRILKAFTLKILNWLPDIEAADDEAARLNIYEICADEINQILEKEKRSA